MPEFDFDTALLPGWDAWIPAPTTQFQNSKPHTFFYPGAGLDFRPLFRLTHLFDRYIFCDLSISEDRFRSETEDIDNIDANRRCDWPTGGLELVGLRRLRPSSIPHDRESRGLLRRIEMSPDEHFRYWRCHDTWQRGPQWGVQATLIRHIGRSTKRITLIYLGAEATVTYLKLFALRGKAPDAICIKPAFQDMGLSAWDSLLGRAVRGSPSKPSIIFGDTHDWPWEVLWQDYGRGWDVTAKVAATLPTLVPQVLDGIRRVHLIPSALSPNNVGNAQAVLIGRQLTGHAWPPGLQVINLGQILDTERGGRANDLERSIQPMDKALQRLGDICRDRGIERVAAVPFGFEDEGQVLTEWRSVDGWPKEITFFCPTPGDFHSLGGSF